MLSLRAQAPLQVGLNVGKEGDVVGARHIAWFSLKRGVSQERIDEHLEAVRRLVDLVSVVLHIECGPNYTDRAGGLTHGIIVTLPGRETLPQ